MGFFSALLGNAGTVTPEELYKEYQRLLTDGETIEIGFKLFRDVFMFTEYFGQSGSSPLLVRTGL